MSTAARVRVIFVSRRNSLRSVLAHACLEHIGGDRYAALSCGSPRHLASEIHPAALGALASARMRPPLGVPTSWDRLKERGAGRASFIITLDDETIELFVNLPLAKGDRASLRADVRDLATMR